MSDRTGIFAGDDPFKLAETWLAEATKSELNDPNSAQLATVDRDGLPNVRTVLIKEIETDAFVFYTNYTSTKAEELEQAGKAAFVFHWKSLRRQLRVRGQITREDGAQADAYYASRPLGSRVGAWASDQSSVILDRDVLARSVEDATSRLGDNPARPEFWGGYRLRPVEFEFWADGASRLHDRFRWRLDGAGGWSIDRLAP